MGRFAAVVQVVGGRIESLVIDLKVFLEKTSLPESDCSACPRMSPGERISIDKNRRISAAARVTWLGFLKYNVGPRRRPDRCRCCHQIVLRSTHSTAGPHTAAAHERAKLEFEKNRSRCDHLQSQYEVVRL